MKRLYFVLAITVACHRDVKKSSDFEAVTQQDATAQLQQDEHVVTLPGLTTTDIDMFIEATATRPAVRIKTHVEKKFGGRVTGTTTQASAEKKTDQSVKAKDASEIEQDIGPGWKLYVTLFAAFVVLVIATYLYFAPQTSAFKSFATRGFGVLKSFFGKGA
jgi:hypothetical protein